MQFNIPIDFLVRGVQCTITPHLYSITLTSKKKKKYYEKAINEQNDTTYNNTTNKFKINLREYYGNYDINEYKEICGILSKSLTDEIRSVEGVNQRFSINKLLKEISIHYDEDINDIAPLLQRCKAKQVKPTGNLADMLNEEEDSPTDPVPIIKGNYRNRIIPISILPILFDRIASFLGLGRKDNTLFVTEIFDEFREDYIRSQINDYHIDDSMVKIQVDVMKENNRILQRMYQRQAFKFYAQKRRIVNKGIQKKDSGESQEKNKKKRKRLEYDKEERPLKKKKIINNNNNEESQDLFDL